MKKLIVLSTIVGICAAAPVLAASPEVRTEMKKMCDHYFMESDTNKDNKISKSEHDTFGMKMFKEADANGDGEISKDEQAANFDRQMSKHDKM